MWYLLYYTLNCSIGVKKNGDGKTNKQKTRLAERGKIKQTKTNFIKKRIRFRLL